MFFSNNNSYQIIAIILLGVLCAHLIAGTLLEKPKIAKALIGVEFWHMLVNAARGVWDIVVWVLKHGFDIDVDEALKWENVKKWTGEKLKKAAQSAAKSAQKRIMDQLVDRLTDTIEGRKTTGGQSQYVKDWKGLLLDALAMGAYEFSQELAGIDLCSPLGFESEDEAKVLLEIPVPKFAEEMPCTAEEMVENITGFYASFEGGWDSWLKVTHPKQNFYGSYLMALDAKVDTMARAQQAESAKVQAGSGWRGLEECTKWFNKERQMGFRKTYSGAIVTDDADRTSPIQYAINIWDPEATNPERLVSCGLAVWDEKGNVLPAESLTEAENCIHACDTKTCQDGDIVTDCDQCKECQRLNQVCLLDYLGFQCTEKKTLTPGDLVGQGVAKMLNYESDWFLSGEDFGKYSAAIVNAGIARASRFGLEKFNQVTGWLSSKFGSKEEEEAARVDATAFCQNEPDIITRRACQMCPGLEKGSKAYRACIEYNKAKVAEDLLIGGALGENMDLANLQGLALLEQAITTKEQISRALQRMGGAAYYSRTKPVLEAMKLLIKCRWQECASHEIRRFLIQHCGISGIQDYGDLATRNNGVLNFNPAVNNCDQNDESKCESLLTQRYAGRNQVRHNYYCVVICAPCVNTTACVQDCVQQPRHNTYSDDGCNNIEFDFSACLELSILEALGSYGGQTIGTYSGTGVVFVQDQDNQFYPYMKTESFTDPKWQNECLVPPITCATSWNETIECFNDMTWRDGHLDHSKFQQKSPRFEHNADNELILTPGWWDFESRIRIDDKILELEKDIGQDSGYPRLHPHDPDVGVIDMTYEYGEKCDAECSTTAGACDADCQANCIAGCQVTGVDDIDSYRVAACRNECQSQRSSCYQDCTHIDVFDELTAEDINAMFTPFGVEGARLACADNENFNQCINENLADRCEEHCTTRICNSTDLANQCNQDCINTCEERKALGVSCLSTISPALHCSPADRYDKIGQLRILQWQILDTNRDLESAKVVRDFIEQTLEKCPAVVPPSPNDPNFNVERYKYERNIIYKAEEEQTLSSEVKNFARSLYIQINGEEPPLCGNEQNGLWIHDARGNYVAITAPHIDENGNPVTYDSLRDKTCPLTMLWWSWDSQPTKNTCVNFTTPENRHIPNGCPLSCTRRYDAWDRPYTFLEYVDTVGRMSVKSLEETLANKTNQIPSQTELQELQSELGKINDMMDPDEIKRKNQDIVQKLNNEHCSDRLDGKGFGDDGNWQNGTWPGED